MDATTLSTLERESNLGGCIGNVLAGHYRVTTEYTEPAKVLHQPVTKHSSRQSSSVNTNNSSRHSYNSSSIDEDDSPDELSSSSQNHNGSFQNNATSNSIGRMKKGRSSSSAHASSLTPSTERTHSSKRWVTFGTGASLVGCSITFYEFLEDGTRIHASTHPLNGIDLSFVHDMAVTEHYYVVLLGPLQFNVGTFVTRYAIGNCTIADCLEYNEAVTSKLFLFPRPGRATAPTGGCLGNTHMFCFMVSLQGLSLQRPHMAKGQAEGKPPVLSDNHVSLSKVWRVSCAGVSVAHLEMLEWYAHAGHGCFALVRVVLGKGVEQPRFQTVDFPFMERLGNTAQRQDLILIPLERK